MKSELKKILIWLKLLLDTLLSIPQVLFTLLVIRYSKKYDFTSDEIIILGNGPSLLEVLNKNATIFREKEVIVVNDFAFSEYFYLMKPKHNVFADPGYWLLNVPDEMHLIREKLIDILNKVEWKLNVYFPLESKGAAIFEKFVNPKIAINFYPTRIAKGFDIWKFWLYNNSIAAPKIQNVIHATIYLAILSGTKEINLFGVEHSWLSTIFVDSENRVCYNNNHFYSEGEDNKVWKNFKGENYILHDLLLDLHHTFKTYHALNQYAKYMSCDIINYTNGSFIDTFKKSDNDF